MTLTTQFSAYDGLALFSGGLDSILAIKLITSQGLRVLGIHLYSPFFGQPEQVALWSKHYDLDLLAIDVSEEYVSLLLNGPKYGWGKVLNPCLDCKIFMLKKVKTMLSLYQAKFIVSGEVIGQRPMSQRRDSLNLIQKQAEVQDILVRPLSALKLPPTLPEKKGLIQRKMLKGIQGRSRKIQLDLAQQFHVQPIPTPAGGCLLTDVEMSKRYLMLIQNVAKPEPRDFWLCRYGRHFWQDKHWLIIGRNKTDNQNILHWKTPKDVLFQLKDVPGPVALAKNGIFWNKELLLDGANLLIQFAPKVHKLKLKQVAISLLGPKEEVVTIAPARLETKWKPPQDNTRFC